MFYDHQSGKIILLGGFYYAPPDKVFTHLNDAWEWDGKTWEYVTTLPRSLMITNPNVAYDSQRQQTTLFDYKQIMTWTGGQWNAIDVDTKPPSPRDAYVMFFDPSRNSFIVYGGISTYALDDMWEYVLP